MSGASLDVFLAEMAALLDGRKSAREVERVLGRSASGTARLAKYRTLVERQQRGVIDEFYSAVRVAADTAQKGSFAALRDAYLTAHPPSHWAPPRAAEHFAAFLERRSSPPELLELADFAWTRHELLQAPARDDAQDLAVRHYTHAVLAFTTEVEKEGKTAGRPAPTAETWLMGRSRHTSRLVATQPSVAALVVVQRLAGADLGDGLPQVSPEQLAQEADQLVALGLVSAAARRSLEGRLG